MPSLPATAYFTLAPDWVCATHAVRHVWLVDPLAKTPEVRTLGAAGRWREVQVYQDDARVRAVPFEAIELDLAALWSPPARGIAVTAQRRNGCSGRADRPSPCLPGAARAWR